MKGCSLLGMLAAMAIGCLGCGRSSHVEYLPSKEVLDLDPKLQKKVAEILVALCGTPDRPKLVGESHPDSARQYQLAHGAEVYRSHCAACHGVTGDGAGPVASFMYPKPRDYRRGIFKFTSTPYGAKPVRSDLVRTVRAGARGTSMPSFIHMADDDFEALIDYVFVLTHRGELELLLALEAGSEDEIAADRVPEMVEEITANWQKAGDQVVELASKPVAYTKESIEIGKKAFLSETAGCYKCHGDDGRGLTKDNLTGFKDVWGFQTRAADLSAGMFHGGQRPLDIYRRIYSGINGTPMPEFKSKLADQPEMFWHLVHYVEYISAARRREVVAQYEARMKPPVQSQATTEGDNADGK